MSGLFWQYLIVALAVGWAVASIARRAWRLLQSAGRGCGSRRCDGCGEGRSGAPLVALAPLPEQTGPLPDLRVRR
jgi:hypothetical protein